MSRTLQILTRLVISVTMVCVLAGCGFQLRGTDGAPLVSVGNRYSISVQTAAVEFRLNIAESLRRRGFDLVSQPADYHIELFAESYNEDDFDLMDDRLDMDMRTMNYAISFRLWQNGSDHAVISQTVAMSIDYTRYGANEVSRAAATSAALHRVRRQVAELLADRLVALVLTE